MINKQNLPFTPEFKLKMVSCNLHDIPLEFVRLSPLKNSRSIKVEFNIPIFVIIINYHRHSSINPNLHHHVDLKETERRALSLIVMLFPTSASLCVSSILFLIQIVLRRGWSNHLLPFLINFELISATFAV
jgi:hypothetical protein